ncbi:MAG: hypothetical protein JXR22_13575 [Prolixibacteraceae bacterium]|nr:hypothetical protein [Prolixibacteraceae bacterium]
MNRTIIILLIALFTGVYSRAQLNGFSLVEYQVGTLPEDTTKNYSTLFSKVHLNYVGNNLYVFGRLESFHSPVEERNYNKITRYGIEYNDNGLTLKAGTINETLARGLLLRSYEIPSAMLEDKGFRVRQSFNRDILGVSGKYSSKHFGMGLLRGNPLFNLLPPTFSESERRPDLVEAAFANVSTFGQNVELGWLRNIEGQKVWNYPWVNLNGSFAKSISYSIVYTQQTNENSSIFMLQKQNSYGIYGNISAYFDQISLNLEVKNYNNLIMGSGYNEPPALIKEHSSRLLNRSSHVLLPQNEKGYQFDLFYSFHDDSRINFNHSLAINEFASKFSYTSFYIEYYKPYETASLKLFADYANDGFMQEKNRLTGGGVFDFSLSELMGEVQLEHQFFTRDETSVSNHVVSIELEKASKYSIGSTLEISNDPFQLTNKSTRSWLGIYARYKYSNKSNFILFAGQRRGGPACTAGICYEILDFEGIEIRWNTKF